MEMNKENQMTLTDIDIDVANRDKLLKLIKGTTAMILRDNNKQNTTQEYITRCPESFRIVSVIKKLKIWAILRLIFNVGLYKDINQKNI